MKYVRDRRVLVAVVVVALAVVVIAAALAVSRGSDSASDRPDAALPSPTASPLRPAPGGGTVDETVAPGVPGPTVRTRIGREARLETGVRVQVLETRSDRARSKIPGEGGGPVLVTRVAITNDSESPIDLDGAFVTLLYGDDEVAEPSASAPSSAVRGELAPGATERGVYVFRLPRQARSSITLIVQAGTEAGVARFVS